MRSFSSSGTKRPERVMTFASLCSRHKAANSELMMLAARTPGTLSAAMAMPMPVPHTSTPRSAVPSATSWATGAA